MGLDSEDQMETLQKKYLDKEREINMLTEAREDHSGKHLMSSINKLELQNDRYGQIYDVAVDVCEGLDKDNDIHQQKVLYSIAFQICFMFSS